MNNQVFVAFDQTQWSGVENLAQALKGCGCGAKVGMELYYSHGPKAVEYLAKEGFPVFLDLKLHDIPHTVEKALKQLLKLPATLFNVHASGGSDMLKAAANALASSGRSDATLIAVTQLTSTSEQMLQQELGFSGKLIDHVTSLALLAQQSGLHGVVCSAWEVPTIKESCGASFLCVTPGIRPRDTTLHDQKRCMTPLEAIRQGSDYLVIGRALSESADPLATLQQFFKE